MRTRVSCEDIQNQLASVENLTMDYRFQLTYLARREIVIEDYRIRLVLFCPPAYFFCIATANVKDEDAASSLVFLGNFRY